LSATEYEFYVVNYQVRRRSWSCGLFTKSFSDAYLWNNFNSYV